MTISACCIIKDEEENLPTYIEGIRKIVDEIIIVDTGSCDNSPAILEGLKDKYKLNLAIYNFEWTDDFSAAKNFALSKATGDWIIFLDADEYFEESDREKIIPLLNKTDPDKSVIGFRSVFWNVDKDKNFETISKGAVIKIFRRSEDIKFFRPIHEQLKYIGQTSAHFADSNLTVVHTGYSSSVLNKKRERDNKIILQNESMIKKTFAADFFYLASAYLDEGNLKKAEENIKKAIDFSKNGDDYLYISFFLFLRDIKIKQNASKKEMRKFMDYAVKMTKSHPDILAQKLADLIQDDPNNITEIEKTAKKILQKAEDKNLSKKYLNKTETYLPFVYNILRLVETVKSC